MQCSDASDGLEATVGIVKSAGWPMAVVANQGSRSDRQHFISKNQVQQQQHQQQQFLGKSSAVDPLPREKEGGSAHLVSRPLHIVPYHLFYRCRPVLTAVIVCSRSALLLLQHSKHTVQPHCLQQRELLIIVQAGTHQQSSPPPPPAAS